jgi:hypothetical protein
LLHASSATSRAGRQAGAWLTDFAIAGAVAATAMADANIHSSRLQPDSWCSCRESTLIDRSMLPRTMRAPSGSGIPVDDPIAGLTRQPTFGVEARGDTMTWWMMKRSLFASIVFGASVCLVSAEDAKVSVDMIGIGSMSLCALAVYGRASIGGDRLDSRFLDRT